jgi:pimeloyl-ACP methyl ester carboxylesterase
LKRVITGILLCLGFLTSKAQDSYYDYIDLGEFNIGYCDSIIYDNEIQYIQYHYEGMAPIFVQIWFPDDNGTNQDYMKLGDFRFKAVPKELSQVYQELTSHMDESFVREGIIYNILTDEPIDYGNLNPEEIFNRLKKTQTKSRRSKIALKPDYPVIVYHHGSQGMSDENSVMAEYFASKGYIFISANFHLPYPNTPFGLLPYDLEKVNKHNQSAARTLISFAKSISANKNVFYIGHSWGAQEGWCFLHQPGLVTGFVSMETTIEFKTDQEEIKDKWPYVFDALKIKKNVFSIPILLFAAKEDNTNFDFFRGLSSEEMVYASLKEPFAHNGYTSFYMMRYFLRNESSQPDSAILLSQIKGYIAHVDLIFAFLEHIRTKNKLDSAKFQELFYIF